MGTNQRSNIVPQQPRREFLAAEIAIDCIMALTAAYALLGEERVKFVWLLNRY